MFWSPIDLVAVVLSLEFVKSKGFRALAGVGVGARYRCWGDRGHTSSLACLLSAHPKSLTPAQGVPTILHSLRHKKPPIILQSPRHKKSPTILHSLRHQGGLRRRDLRYPGSPKDF